ncbi:MAG: aminotransferase class III-fold pyridoxal phosphate-dependent enzyme [Rhizobiales bacterium]|nr:aminotransferase class III-fold pyridoxal phosphate-dependent enzyme [Hyphomicrobiales bacterium]OJX98577.1 MAG: hypothetical protein BGP07_10855 [Rhizobiales bacterium 63-22]
MKNGWLEDIEDRFGISRYGAPTGTGIATVHAMGKLPLSLLREIGAFTARLDRALSGNHAASFSHAEIPTGISAHLDGLDAGRRAIIGNIAENLTKTAGRLQKLPVQIIHGIPDADTISVIPGLAEPARIAGIAGFDDLKIAPRIFDLAAAATCAAFGDSAPEIGLSAIVAGYHEVSPLTADEVDLLWPLVGVNLASRALRGGETALGAGDGQSAAQVAPFWHFLEKTAGQNGLVCARLRVACGFPATSSSAVLVWLDRNRGSFAPILDADLAHAPVKALSVEESTVPRNPFVFGGEEARNLGRDGTDDGFWLGRYGEPRLLYVDTWTANDPDRRLDRQTVCPGVDIFTPAGCAVHAPLDGQVAMVGTGPSGGRVLLRHRLPTGEVFFTIYDRLDPDSIALLREGQGVDAAAAFARVGYPETSGGMAAHLRFQLAISVEGFGYDYPDAVDPDDSAFWLALCPNPAALLNISDAAIAFRPLDTEALLAERRALFSANLKLSYRRPVTFLRGWRHYLFDEMGRTYLDAYNNVPHVGHAHPRIRDVAARQLERMNSNTRYLHPSQIGLARRLTAKLPKELDVCFFVNSGSEANELALRLARAASGGYDIVTPDHGYHGNTTGAIDISAYKFNKPGMGGRKPWVHLVDVADDYRGRFRRDDEDRALRYAMQVDDALKEIERTGGRLAGFIAETFPSVGGQIIPPPGYLAEVYARVRAAGGICIADEVQTGLGRLGDYYFGFEQQAVRPDVVVLGKPLGNGHPIGAVITTRHIAEKFAEGPEYFSTFGGSNLSCLIASEVLDIVEDDGLQGNARIMGDRLLAGLRVLAEKYRIVGDVRGIGLFIGLDLVLDRESRAPATRVADHVMNRLRDMRILVGREGPDDNILKIRPPLTIEAEDVDFLLLRLDECLKEAELALG